MPAHAANVSLSLSSGNGEGSFDPSLPCSSGDGPSWRYAYSGFAAAPAGSPLGGTWNGTVEVHQTDLSSLNDSSFGAFVPAGTGRIQVKNALGSMLFEFSGGGCRSASMTFRTDSAGDPLVSGTLPLVATGGTGSLRGLSGAGSATTSFELGDGADNAATVALNGKFRALAPALSVGTASPFWGTLLNYLNHNLRVSVPVSDGGPQSSVGDAFAVTITSATLSGVGGASSGVPASLGELRSGQGRAATVSFHGASPGHHYTLTVTVAARDALGDAVAPVTVSQPVTAPLTP